MWRFGIFSVLCLSDFHLVASKLSLRYPNSQPDPTACQCVPRQDCLNGDFELRKTCQNHGRVCCAPASISNSKRQSRSSELSNVGQQNDKNMSNPETPTRANSGLLRKCGHRNPNGLDPTDTVERTDEAKFGEFPWMAELLFKNHTNKEGKVVLFYYGGASLIHRKAALTAAHCVARITAGRLLVRAGEWDQRNRKEYLPHAQRNARSIIIHEDFFCRNNAPCRNDYAIVILESPFTLEPHIGLVCLPDRMSAFDPSRCVASGWGKKVFAKGQDGLKILKKVELPLVSIDACRNTIGISIPSILPLHESMLCAGGKNGKDMCDYDSGSPLVCPTLDDATRYVQVGIVSLGPAICGKWIPGLYSDVEFAREWIVQKLHDNGFGVDSNAALA